MDPAQGRIVMCLEDFEQGWLTDAETGVVLELRPSQNGLHIPAEIAAATSVNVSAFGGFWLKHRRSVATICAFLTLTAGLDLLMPRLSQTLFDSGIGNGKISIVLLVLAAQLSLTFGRMLMSFLQAYFSLETSNRIGVDLTLNLMKKFARLPKKFFDFKSPGEILQTSYDISRIEQFFTYALPTVFISVISLILTSAMLIWYDYKILLIYFPFIIIIYLWIFKHISKRLAVDMKMYALEARLQDKILEYVKGIDVLKLVPGAAPSRQKIWEQIREKYNKLMHKGLSIDQRQSVGVTVVSRAAELVVTGVTVIAVINKTMSIGQMIAIQYLVGSLSSPSQSLVFFMRQIQDYLVSANRLKGVCTLEDEHKLTAGLPVNWHSDISFDNVSFAYNPDDGLVIKDINLQIPIGSTVALVGDSGSGKSTLLRLILGLYRPTSGKISVDGNDLQNLNKSLWREHCMTAWADNYIFDDSIAANIALSEDSPEQARIEYACKMACLDEFVRDSVNGLETQIGPGGSRLSNGQRQRLILARAFYYRPDILLMDEATNALDVNNEMKIYRNIYKEFKNATVVIAAHRLSTIRKADLIVVLSSGRIVEKGSHEQLMANGGQYAKMVSMQL